MVLTFLKPGIIEAIMSGEAEIQGLKIGPEILMMYAIIVLFPLAMAFLTVTLKDSINRGANIIMGIVGVVLSIVGISGELAQPYAYAVLIWVSKIVVDALIVWYACKWPKEKT
jgi:uncharacterized membrane protein